MSVEERKLEMILSLIERVEDGEEIAEQQWPTDPLPEDPTKLIRKRCATVSQCVVYRAKVIIYRHLIQKIKELAKVKV